MVMLQNVLSFTRSDSMVSVETVSSPSPLIVSLSYLWKREMQVLVNIQT